MDSFYRSSSITSSISDSTENVVESVQSDLGTAQYRSDVEMAQLNSTSANRVRRDSEANKEEVEEENDEGFSVVVNRRPKRILRRLSSSNKQTGNSNEREITETFEVSLSCTNMMPKLGTRVYITY